MLEQQQKLAGLDPVWQRINEEAAEAVRAEALRVAVVPRVDAERPRLETPERLPVVAPRVRRRFSAAWRWAADEGLRLRVLGERVLAVRLPERAEALRVLAERLPERVVGARAPLRALVGLRSTVLRLVPRVFGWV